MKSWASSIVDNLNTNEIIETVVTEVINNLDIETFAKEIQDRVVVRLSERIMIELNEAIYNNSSK